MQPLRSVGRSNFDKGRHNLTTLIKKRHILMKAAIYIYTYIYGEKNIVLVLVPRVDSDK